MSEPNSNSEGIIEKKTTLVAKIDQRVLPALDQIASTNRVNTSQLMGRFFNDVADSVDLLAFAQGSSSENVEEKLARLIVEGCPATTTEALQAVQRIYQRAAQIKAQEGGHQC